MDREAVTQQVSRHNAVIYTILFGFIAGVLVSSFLPITPLLAAFLILLSLAILVIEKVRDAGLSHEAVLVTVALLCFGLGALRYDIKDFHEPLTPSGEGVAASEPEHRDTDTRFVYEADNGERALVSTDMYSHVEYGDRVSVSCKFKAPEPIAEDNGRVFDYPKFLSKDDIYYTCGFARVEEIVETSSPALGQVSGQSRSIMFHRSLLRLKNAFTQRMKTFLPEPESSLLAGLIVAGKDALPKSVLRDFQNAGVVHIVVLSGYNITVVAEFFLVLLGSLSLRKRASFAALGILLFVLMAGGSASIVRAAIMAMVVLLGKVIHRGYSASRTLLLAAALMIMWNPKILVYDPSFHLSFLAMLALIYAEPIVDRLLSRGVLATRDGIRELLATTIATQLTVLPYLLYSSGSVSIVSLLSNILILGFVPVTMLIGFLATVIAFVSPIIAWPLGFIAHLLLAWILGVAHTLGSFSYAQIKISHMSLWLTLILYVGYIAAGKYIYSKMKPPA